MDQCQRVAGSATALAPLLRHTKDVRVGVLALVKPPRIAAERQEWGQREIDGCQWGGRAGRLPGAAGAGARRATSTVCGLAGGRETVRRRKQTGSTKFP